MRLQDRVWIVALFGQRFEGMLKTTAFNRAQRTQQDAGTRDIRL